MNVLLLCRVSEGSNFYKQMAADLSTEEEEEEEEEVSEVDAKQLADSLDVDNMDANLFGAFKAKKSSSSSSIDSTRGSRGTTSQGPSRPSPAAPVTSRQEPARSMAMERSSQESVMETRPRTTRKPPLATTSEQNRAKDEGV